jgi:tRNA modification GTPase
MLQNALSEARFSRRNVFLRHLQARIVSRRVSTLRSHTSGPREFSKQRCTHLQKRHYYATTRDALIYGDDTIYALSTALGRAGLAIVRISGPSCVDVRYNTL